MLDAGAVIHSHSKWANLVTMLYPGNEFRITYQEMIKGIKNQATGKNYRYDDQLVVPIIENTCFESDLKVFHQFTINFFKCDCFLLKKKLIKEEMAEVMKRYPSTAAVLVRRHGVYIWGETWEETKSMYNKFAYFPFFSYIFLRVIIEKYFLFRSECYHYLFELACEMKKFGLEPSIQP